jgi:hypothetical protein
MSDDLERRIREAFQSAPLPAASESLRATVLSIPSDARASALETNRSQGRFVPIALAAVVIVALAGIVATGRQPSAAGPSPSSTITASEPPIDLHVLSAAELGAAIAAQRLGGLAPQDVVADVAIDAGQRTPPLTRDCVPAGVCDVIGTLVGFSARDGTVTVGRQIDIKPPPITPTDLGGPVALRLQGADPIVFLGHVALNDSRASSVSEALTATETAADGEVLLVDGWLEGIGLGFSADVRPVLTTQPVKPLVRFPNGYEFNPPPGSISVQGNAYEQFAPNPGFDGTNKEPRHALYLLRMVAGTCARCRDWIVIGRLDATATPAPNGSPAADLGVSPNRPERPCTALATSSPIPPRVSLVSGGRVTAGHVVSYTWNGAMQESKTLVPAVAAAANYQATAELRIQDDQCAFGWYVAFGPKEAPSNGPILPAVTGTLGPTLNNPQHDPAAQENAFIFAAPPPGDWIIEATFDFGASGWERVMWELDVR